MAFSDKGKPGQQIIYNFYLNQGFKVQDTTENPQYFAKDIDFIVSKGDEVKTVQVKYDYQIGTYGNIFAQITKNLDWNKPGWLLTCEAQEMAYGDAQNDIFYFFKLDDLRQYIKEHPFLNRAKFKDKDKITGETVKVVEGVLVPIQDFIKEYPVKRIEAA